MYGAEPGRHPLLGLCLRFAHQRNLLVKSTVTPVGDDRWADVDAVIFFWARRSELATGLDERLLAALRTWFNGEWRLERAVYVTNEQFGQQVNLLERTDLSLKFELLEPGKPGKYLLFG